MMSSVWHAILDNFRPITITSRRHSPATSRALRGTASECMSMARPGRRLTLFYTLPDSGYGEAWTAGSWLQLFGMGLLLVSTAVYNGSLKVSGRPLCCRRSHHAAAADLTTRHQTSR